MMIQTIVQHRPQCILTSEGDRTRTHGLAVHQAATDPGTTPGNRKTDKDSGRNVTLTYVFCDPWSQCNMYIMNEIHFYTDEDALNIEKRRSSINILSYNMN